MESGAIFDPTGAYRYRLWRQWDLAKPSVGFIMLNPSTADAHTDDATIRRCLGFARDWGFGRLEVANLFAYRATRPRDLLSAQAPAGRDNAYYIDELVSSCTVLVAAWGNPPAGLPLPAMTLTEVWCLGLTRFGNPRHPLYVPASTRLVRFDCTAPGAAGTLRAA